ncbi:serine/threonine-protein kinase [Streptomyces sp. NPDC049040]|uniref:serine/threonine-protein kinase n=1 Tax=Streptomyces sp. NPDC049040 TaxID=3365593 RepID=UPI003723655A
MAMMRLRREDPRVVGAFRLHRRLGAGGMGVVYLGADKRGQRVALKVIRPELAEDQEFRSRFAREVSAARRIRGGCTARLVAADLEAERPWFATQYVPGPSLHDKVAEHGVLAAAEVASIGAALAEGLVAVHEAGVVHRDLKPSNILLSPKGPRIIDFGIAWATGASTLTHVGTAVGSPGFLAPEQVRGAAVTPATDVFAFGATLAYAATADSPFGQGSSEVMLYRVVHEEPDLAGVPDVLAPLVHACLAKDPEERPSTVQLSERLAEIAAREARGIGAPRREALPKAAGPRPERPVGRRAEEYAQQRTRRSPQGPEGTGTGGGRSTSRTPSVPPARTPVRTGGGRRPTAPAPGRRLLRQRLVVFVIVTLLAAICIAAVQGCHRFSRGTGAPAAPSTAPLAPGPEGP